MPGTRIDDRRRRATGPIVLIFGDHRHPDGCLGSAGAALRPRAKWPERKPDVRLYRHPRIDATLRR
jgi:hypothetical protein